jgi:hypothetical protein
MSMTDAEARQLSRTIRLYERATVRWGEATLSGEVTEIGLYRNKPSIGIDGIWIDMTAVDSVEQEPK